MFMINSSDNSDTAAQHEAIKLYVDLTTNTICVRCMLQRRGALSCVRKSKWCKNSVAKMASKAFAGNKREHAKLKKLLKKSEVPMRSAQLPQPVANAPVRNTRAAANAAANSS